MARYIWQLPPWRDLSWDDAALLRPLGKTRQAQGELFAKTGYFELELQADMLSEETFTTAAIEGETLDREGVRSSVARRLGLPTAGLHFVTIHPFSDGNGRLARAIADMALAQDENRDYRLYSMSARINAERARYYAVLEQTQKGGGDITDWITWFLECLQRAIHRSNQQINTAMDKARFFWQAIARHTLNARQRKVINTLLESGPGGFEGGLTSKKYRGMTRTTRETAKRAMADLVNMGLLKKNPGGGRSTSYDLIWPA